MIIKFKSIDNIGSFFHFNWDDVNPAAQLDTTGVPILDSMGVPKIIINKFNKFNVLFGENGTGKTTLVKLFKTLNEDSAILIQKHWDHEGSHSSFEFETDSVPISFTDTNGIQNNFLKDKVLIFDRDYIDSFVHSFPVGRAANHNKNTGNLILYLGNFYQYRTQLNNLLQLRKNLQEKNSKIISKNEADFIALKSTHSYAEVKIEFDTFGAIDFSKVMELALKKSSAIEDIRKEIKNIEQKIIRSGDIVRISSPKEIGIQLLVDQNEIDRVFSFSISAAAATAMARVSGRENFVKEGVQIMHEHNLSDCPFCEQPIKNSESYIPPIAEYEAIFDSVFIDEQDNARRALQDYKDQVLSILGFQIPEANNAIIAKMNSLLGQTHELPSLVLSEDEKNIIKAELENIEKKQRNIVNAGTSNAATINEVIKTLNSKITDYNKIIRTISQKLEEVKNEISSGDLPKQRDLCNKNLSKESLSLFIYQNYNELSKIFSVESIVAKNEDTIKKIAELFETLRRKVEELFKIFVATYFSEIEKNLSVFCPGLQLKMVGAYPGYDMRVGDVTCGLEVHYKNRDRLKDLSEGERQAIALSYFLAFLNKEINKGEKIVVFDDPINSFDSGRRKQAAELIYKEASSFKQLFIFTCDSLFKSYSLKVANKRLGTQRHFYYVLKSASSSVHYRPKNYQTIYSSFKQDFRNIASVAGTDDMIVVYGQKLRYCLEEIKDRHLGYSEDKFEDILTAVETGRITNLISKIDEVRELYSYCNTGGLAHFPKDGQTSWGEIKLQIEKYMRLGI